MNKELEEARQDYYRQEYSHASNLEDSRGDDYKRPEFESECNADFYEIIIEQLITLIEQPYMIRGIRVLTSGSEVTILSIDREPTYAKGVLEYHSDARWHVKIDDLVYDAAVVRFE
ncbi:MAG: hypothetical protein JSS76_08335 [Bacteroidetes bacterium]|nr:hypothetical protein [Bacteroidota bacterium]